MPSERTKIVGYILLASGLLLAGAVTATQWLAHAFDYQRALGTSLRIGDVRLYAPWAFAQWDARWASDYPAPFAIARIVFFSFAMLALVITVSVKQRDFFKARRWGARAWASAQELADAGLYAASGFVLGRFGRRFLVYDGPGHQLLIGASRSGKGRGHVVPTLLSWSGSALVMDIKGELSDGDARHGFPGTSGYRALLGPVLRFAPTEARSASFNPLLEVPCGLHDVRAMQNITEILVDPAGDLRGQDFWDRSAKPLITGVALHVLYTEPLERKNLAVVREKLRNLGQTAEEMRTTLHRLSPVSGQPEVHPEILHAAESYLGSEERVRSGIKATAESFFGIFADPLVAEKTATSDFRISDLMCGAKPVTLFLQPPPSDAQRLMSLMRLILNQVTQTLMEHQTKDAQGRPKRHRLMLMLDEFPQLGRMGFFETAMGAMAGYGIKAYLVCQSSNHITRAYTRENVIIDNCAVVVAFAAADVETAKAISAMVGDIIEVRPQPNRRDPSPFLGDGKGSTTYREERRPLLMPGEVRALPRDEQLIFVHGEKPIRAKKLKFDQEKIFKSRLLPPAPDSKVTLSTAHDWTHVRPIGRLIKDDAGAVRVVPYDMFGELTISQRASAGLRAARPSDNSLSAGI